MQDFFDKLRVKWYAMLDYFEMHVLGIVIIVLLLLGVFMLFPWQADACVEIIGRRWQPVDGCAIYYYENGQRKEKKPEVDDSGVCSGSGQYHLKDLPAWRGFYFRAHCGDSGRSSGKMMVVANGFLHLFDLFPRYSLPRRILLGNEVNYAWLIVLPSDSLYYWEEGYSDPSTAKSQVHH